MRRHIVFEIILAELGRALAAARRYESLKYGRARHAGLAAADIPRRIFEEFYAFADGCGTRPDGFGPILTHRRRCARVPLLCGWLFFHESYAFLEIMGLCSLSSVRR